MTTKTYSFWGGEAILELELRAFTLSHSTSPILVKGFSKQGLMEVCAWAGFKLQFS
jgi:hypothetical protein